MQVLAPGRRWLDQVAAIAERGLHLLDRTSLARPSEVGAGCARLLAQRGEASSLALASELVAAIGRMRPAETLEFLDLLSRDFGPDPERIQRAVGRWQESAGPGSLADLSEAVEAPRQELFRRLNMVPGGTRTLVDLRGRLLDIADPPPQLAAVDADLRHLFASWFNRGFLSLEQIDWHTPADVLERLIEYEAVHEIQGWDDLRSRLAADRRCFAFFHPALPGDPLIFVEAALTKGLASAIGPLIDPGREVADPASADTAIFFSISNCQRGLRGISFGSFLIKQVTGRLEAELPKLRTYATLSPVPGLAAALSCHDTADGFSSAQLRSLVGASADTFGRLAGTEDLAEALTRLVSGLGPRPPGLDRELSRLALAYLLKLQRNGRVADPVAHFHLSNGARLERVNPAAGGAERARESLGVMVNYLYDPERLEVNHEQYVQSGRLIVGGGLNGEVRRVEAAWSRAAAEPGG